MVLKTENGDYEMGAPKAPKISSLRRAMPQILAVAVKNLLLLAFGMTLGYPTILIPGLTDPAETFTINPEGLSWIGSINLICVPLGCILSGAISQAIGRKRSMQAVNIPFVIAWLMFWFSNEEWQIFVALALTGLTGGFLEAPVLTYVAEISQPHLRGMLSTTSSLAVIIGVLIMFCLGTFFPWRTVALISCGFNVVSFNLLFFVPESPHWLISKTRLLEARKSLAWLRGWTDVDDIEVEYKQIYGEMCQSQEVGVDNPAFDGNMNGTTVKVQAKPNKSKLDTLRLLTKKDFIVRFGLVTYIFFISHFTGITTLSTYAVQIFVSLNSPIDKYYATVILGIVDVLGCVVCVLSVHYAGKRLLNFISLLGGIVCFFLVAVYTYSNGIQEIAIPEKLNVTSINITKFDESNNENSWIPMTLLIAYAFIAHVGLRGLPWVLIGEVYSNETRAPASGLSSAASYIIGFVANKSFFAMIALLTLPGTFLFYSIVGVVGFITLYFWLPETEGKTLGQINDHFTGVKNMGNHVYRKHKKKEKPIRLGTINQAYITDGNNRIESRL